MKTTHFDWSTIKPIPGFDCVAEKNRIQAKIYEETKDMSPEEEREYRRRKSEKFWQEIEEIRRKNAETEGGNDR